MYPDVLRIETLPSCRLFVELDNGRKGIFDMHPFTGSPFFAELQNEAYFQKARIECGVITWPHGQDISPATIDAELRKGQEKDLPISASAARLPNEHSGLS